MHLPQQFCRNHLNIRALFLKAQSVSKSNHVSCIYSYAALLLHFSFARAEDLTGSIA